MREPECSYIGRCNSSRCPKHGLSDIQRAAAKALVELRRLPVEKQGDAFVLLTKLVIEAGAINLSATVTGGEE